MTWIDISISGYFSTRWNWWWCRVDSRYLVHFLLSSWFLCFDSCFLVQLPGREQCSIFCNLDLTGFAHVMKIDFFLFRGQERSDSISFSSCVLYPFSFSSSLCHVLLLSRLLTFQQISGVGTSDVFVLFFRIFVLLLDWYVFLFRSFCPIPVSSYFSLRKLFLSDSLFLVDVPVSGWYLKKVLWYRIFFGKMNNNNIIINCQTCCCKTHFFHFVQLERTAGEGLRHDGKEWMCQIAFFSSPSWKREL